MSRLDKFHKKDDTLSKFDALESFETYERPSSTLSILEYTVNLKNASTRLKIVEQRC